MTEKKNNKPDRGLDVRIAFENGKKSSSLVVRGATRAAEYLWDSGILLGEALANVPKKRKIK